MRLSSSDIRNPGRQSDACASTRGRAGFSLVELLLCLGVLMILLGLVLPMMSGARERAIEARMLGTMKSNGALISMYAHDHDMLFPNDSQMVGKAVLDWPSPLKAAGLIDGDADVDPDGVRRHRVQRVSMTAAAVCLPDRMVPGATLPLDMSVATTMRLSQVRHPAAKGVLVQYVQVRGDTHELWSTRFHRGPSLPVTFADGSVISARSREFALEFDFYEDWVGHPVLSTWRGVYGVDQRGGR